MDKPMKEALLELGDFYDNLFEDDAERTVTHEEARIASKELFGFLFDLITASK